jgi:hypothetical protein
VNQPKARFAAKPPAIPTGRRLQMASDGNECAERWHRHRRRGPHAERARLAHSWAAAVRRESRFDATKLSWIGSATKHVSVCLAWHDSGIASLKDATRRDVLVGSSGYAADSNIFPLLVNETVRTRFKPVLGYADSGAVGIAMEQGELDGYCGFTISAIKSARPQWLERREVNILCSSRGRRIPTCAMFR